MEVLKNVCKALDDVKAIDIVAIDMRGFSPLFDYMVVCEANTARQANALVSSVSENMNKAGYAIDHTEGKNEGWVLIDCKDVIVNIFTHEDRGFYGIEKLYMDLPRIDVNELLG